MVVRSVAWQKGGNLTRLALAAKLRYQIAKSPIAVAELTGDVGQRTVLDEKSAEGFIPPVEDLNRLAEEPFSNGVIHDRHSGIVMRFFRNRVFDVTVNFQGLTRPKLGQNQKGRIFRLQTAVVA